MNDEMRIKNIKMQTARLIYLEKELNNLIHNCITEYVLRCKDINVDELRESLLYHLDEQLDLLKQNM